jgi:hypothetical protein
MLWLTTAISETPPGGTWKVGRSNSVRASQLLHPAEQAGMARMGVVLFNCNAERRGEA